MTLAQTLAPIAASTILNVVFLGLAWRWTQREKRHGRTPWYLEAVVVAYMTAGGIILYLLNKRAIAGPAELFGAALIGEALGALVIFSVFHAVFRKDVQPTGQRVFEIGASLLMLTVIIGSLFV